MTSTSTPIFPTTLSAVSGAAEAFARLRRLAATKATPPPAPELTVMPDPMPGHEPTLPDPDPTTEPAPIIPDPNPNPEPAPIIPDPNPNPEPAPIIPDPTGVPSEASLGRGALVGSSAG